MSITHYLNGETWGFPGRAVEHIETHAAHVFLVEDRAYKIKKPVKLPYLDFSTRELRRDVLTRELELNRRFAPDLYLGLIAIGGEPVLEMVRFDTAAMLSSIADAHGVSATLAGQLAQTAAEAHAKAPRHAIKGSAIMAGLNAQLAKAFMASPDIFDSRAARDFIFRYETMLSTLTPLLDRRSGQGLIRYCHGDMHCANIVLQNGKPVLFDCIEFSDRIATIDVLYDLAYLLMDLVRRGEHAAANIVLNRYMLLRRSEEDLSGLAALPLFLATRAGVRALVMADLAHELDAASSQSQRREAQDYFARSLFFLKPAPPVLVCVGGLSGTGKSTIAKALAPRVGGSPGAIHVRSDVERKALAGVAELDRLPKEAYAPAAAGGVYCHLLARAETALKAGHAVILDAVYAREEERHAAEALARKLRVAFRGIWLEAPPETLRTRVAARTGDASDADLAVVEKQLAYNLGRLTWTRINAEGSPAQVLSRFPAIL
jgi:hypothetical protein